VVSWIAHERTIQTPHPHQESIGKLLLQHEDTCASALPTVLSLQVFQFPFSLMITDNDLSRNNDKEWDFFPQREKWRHSKVNVNERQTLNPTRICECEFCWATYGYR
jgi:hypothetical protein